MDAPFNMRPYLRMITWVAEALGPDLLPEMAFVGGCTTGLLLTDAFSQEQVRHTDDVDLIVHVMGQVGWAQLQAQLGQRGFVHDMHDHDSPICAMRLRDMRVDFMPDDTAVLGFSNKWYAQALLSAQPHALPGTNINIRLVTPPYFIATKLEAYKGRGNNDPLGSRDVEDILALVDGRAELLLELQQAPANVQAYVSTELTSLMKHNMFDYAVASAAGNDPDREQLIFERLTVLARGA